MLKASERYGLPLAQIRAVYIGHGQAGERAAGIGRRDFWEVWFAADEDLEAVFAPTPQAPVTMRASARRAADKLARLMGQVKASTDG